jgi:hypothetical protein
VHHRGSASSSTTTNHYSPLPGGGLVVGFGRSQAPVLTVVHPPRRGDCAVDDDVLGVGVGRGGGGGSHPHPINAPAPINPEPAAVWRRRGPFISLVRCIKNAVLSRPEGEVRMFESPRRRPRLSMTCVALRVQTKSRGRELATGRGAVTPLALVIVVSR